MQSTSDVFSVAVVGFGWWGKYIVDCLKDHPDIKVRLVVARSADTHAVIRSAGLQAGTDIGDALSRDDIDAVILTTPNPVHEEQVRLCAAAGKHVFCEKPLGLTGDSAKRSVHAAESHETVHLD